MKKIVLMLILISSQLLANVKKDSDFISLNSSPYIYAFDQFDNVGGFIYIPSIGLVPVPSPVPPDGDTSSYLYWLMEEDPNLWYDSSSNANHAAVVDNISVYQTNAPAGELGSYLFDGSTKYGDGGTNVQAQLAAGSNMTFRAVVNLASDGQASSGRMLDSRDISTTKGMMFLCNAEAGGFVSLYCKVYMSGTDANAVSTVTVPLNEWVDCAAVFNEDGDNKIKLYTNGVIATLGTDIAGTGLVDFNLAQPITIGDARLGLEARALDGYMRGASVWSASKTAAEISTIYSSGVTIADAGLEAYWAMTNPAIIDSSIATSTNWPGAYGEMFSGGFTLTANNTNYYFQNNSDYCYTPGTFTANTQYLSTGCWVKPRSIDDTGAIMSKRKTGFQQTDVEWLLRNYTDGPGNTRFDIHQSSNVYISAYAPALTTGVWQKVEGIYEAPTNIWIYVNGVDVTTNVIVTGAMTEKASYTNTVFVGTYSDAKLDHFPGQQWGPYVSNSNLTDVVGVNYSNELAIVDTFDLWTPAEIDTIGWYDASNTSTIHSVAGLVSKWDDLSGVTNDLTQGTGLKQPTTDARTQNGLNVLDFDGGDALVNVAFNLSSSGDLVVIGVAGIDAINNDFDSVWSLNGATNDVQFDAVTSPNFEARLFGNGIGGDATFGGDNKGPSVYASIFDYSTASNYYTRIDGTIGSATNYLTKLDTSQTLGIFRNRNGTQFPNGFVGEFVIYCDDVSTSTVEKTEGYLSHKWGIEAKLPTNHPYYSSPPLN